MIILEDICPLLLKSYTDFCLTKLIEEEERTLFSQ